MMNNRPKIGAYVLETLTTGMYTNPFDCIREYIQNAFDSILSAENFKILNRNTGIITITIDPQKRSISIRDNGTGIQTSEIIPRLLNIGMSGKIFGQEAGFRGIGRLAGIAYCKQLQFITSSKYEEVKSIVSFDCEAIRASISPSLREVEELADVLHKNQDQNLYDCKKDDHFFEVRLENIEKSGSNFLEEKQLENYLSQVVPVEYDAQSFLFAPKIEEWANEKGINIPYVKLTIQNPDLTIDRQVFKPYKSHYRTKNKDFDIHIKDIAFYPEEINSNTPFWLWYSKTDLLGMFDDDKVAGLRFRRNNIAIGGPERVSELFPGKEGRLNYWTIGEIHILSDNIIPNARRDGFETNEAWHLLCSELQPFIKSHCKNCHDTSDAKNRPTVKIVSSARSTIESTKEALRIGLTSNAEKERLLSKIDKEFQRANLALENRKTQQEKDKISSILTSLKTIKNNIEDEKSFTLKKIKSNLDRKQRKILKDVMEILNFTFDNIPCAKSNNCLKDVKKAIIEKYQVNEND